MGRQGLTQGTKEGIKGFYGFIRVYKGIRLEGPNYVSTIRNLTTIQIRNENAVTKCTVFSPNSATTKRQLTSSTTDSNIN